MTVHLVTAHKNEAHITSADSGALNAILLGSGVVIADGLECTAPTANKAVIAPGEVIAEGRFVRVTGEPVNLTLDSGTAGQKRHDIVAIHYKRETSSVENINFVVIKGTPTTGTPTDPAMPTSGKVLEGATEAYWPLYRILIDGITPQTPVRIVSTRTEYLRKQYLDSVYPVGAVYMSFASTNPGTLFGGTWQQVTDRYLRAANDVNTGGSNTVTLTTANMPSHSHTVNSHTHQFTRVSGMYGTKLSSKQCALPWHTHVSMSGAHMANIASGTSYTTNVVNNTSTSSNINTTGSAEVTYSAEEHTHGLTSASFNTGGATPGTSATGSGTAFTAMPAYQNMYVWRRTA